MNEAHSVELLQAYRRAAHDISKALSRTYVRMVIGLAITLVVFIPVLLWLESQLNAPYAFSQLAKNGIKGTVMLSLGLSFFVMPWWLGFRRVSKAIVRCLDAALAQDDIKVAQLIFLKSHLSGYKLNGSSGLQEVLSVLT